VKPLESCSRRSGTTSAASKATRCMFASLPIRWPMCRTTCTRS
jgi:hypothetical protein